MAALETETWGRDHGLDDTDHMGTGRHLWWKVLHDRCMYDEDRKYDDAALDTDPERK